MTLEVELSAVGTLPVSEVVFERAVGRPVRWRCLLELSRDDAGDKEIDQLVSGLGTGPMEIQPTLDGSSLGPKGVVTRAEWASEVGNQLWLEATATFPKSENPFRPRRRVHHVTTLLELARRLEGTAVLTTGVRTRLSKIDKAKLRDEGKTSLVQDGLSDWELFAQLLHQYALLEDEESSRALVLSGGVDEDGGTEGRWVASWARSAAYLSHNAIAARTVERSALGKGRWRTSFGSITDSPSLAGFPTGSRPEVIHSLHQRDWDAGRWSEWRSRDVPLFLNPGQRFVWRVEDRIFLAKGQGEIGYRTDLCTVPPDTVLPGPLAPPPVRPWVGWGKVTRSSQMEPWIEVKLDGFESGSDLVNARLGTPYSGKNGKRGLHLVPEEGTEVFVVWSGRFDDSVVYGGNARGRKDQAELPAPSLWLERTLKGQLEAVEIEKIGKVTVGSALEMTVKASVKLDVAANLETSVKGQVKLEGTSIKSTASGDHEIKGALVKIN